MSGNNYIHQEIDNTYDTIDQSFGVIDSVHKNIHEGHSFLCASNKTASGAADFINVFYVGAGSGKAKRHFVIDISADKAGVVYLREATKSSGAGGTTRTPLNQNRTSTRASVHPKVKEQPSTFATSTGTLLYASFIGANSPPTRIGGNIGTRQEYILKSSASYLLRFDPGSAATNVLIVASWYEE